MNGADQMVVFPTESDEWRDSGEGGLWTMLIVRKPDEHRFNCSVDTGIFVGEPDVCVSHGRHNRRGKNSSLWADADNEHRTAWWRAQTRVHQDKEFKSDDYLWLRRLVAQARTPWDQSDEVLAAVHMGSTPCSLYSERHGSYFIAGYEHLTQNGKTIFDGLRLAYGAAPELYTFLDT